MSTAQWLARVGHMSRREVVFRARAAARERVEHVAGAWRDRGWRRERLARILVPTAGPVRTALERLEARDWMGAHGALADHFHRRVSRFPISPHALPELAEILRRRFPHAPADAAARADRITAGRFDLLGYHDLTIAAADGSIDWHADPVHRRRAPRTWWARVPYLEPGIGDHKVIWELNRHQHVLALGRAAWLTGRPGYGRTFVRHLGEWLRDNPPLVGINWASMLEIALRSISWVWALHLFVESPGPRSRAGAPDRRSEHAPMRPERPDEASPWLLDLLVGLDRQLSHVEHNLSLYFSPNTHLTGEGLGLYVCGRALPELAAAASWERTGRDVLLDQIDRQIARDGGHLERSTHYQRYTLDYYLLALAMARVTDDPCADRFADAVDRLASATRLLAGPDGQLPRIGDDDGGALFPMCGRPASDVRDSLAAAGVLLSRPALVADPLPEEALWLVGCQPDWIITCRRRRATGSVEDSSSGSLPQTGYYVSRPTPCDHLVIDGGPHGYLNGGHAHADALSLTATLSSRPLFIDPGTATYTMSAEVRDRFRSSRMHNTLTLDGRSQSVPAGPFHWAHVASARTERWHASPAFDYFEGTEDGYRPAVHRRRVLIVPRGPVLVVDTVTGDDDRVHVAEVLWHLDPAWRPRGDERGVAAIGHASGARAWIVSPDVCTEFLIADDEGLGWHSPAYGRVEPAFTVRLSKSGVLPLTIVTVFDEGPADAAPRVSCLAHDAAGRGDAVVLQLDADGRRDVLIFGAPGHRVRAGAFESSARFAWLDASDPERPRRLVALDEEV
jgi:hypothetical protein